MSVVLFIPRQHFKYVNNDSGLNFGVMQAKALADYGHIVYMVLPSKETHVYKKPLIEHERVKPLYFDLIKDQMTGTGTYSYDLLALVTTRRAKIPYEVVINHNNPMSVGLQRPLMEKGVRTY